MRKTPAPKVPAAADYRVRLLPGQLFVNGVETDFLIDHDDRTAAVAVAIGDHCDRVAFARACFAAGWEACRSGAAPPASDPPPWPPPWGRPGWRTEVLCNVDYDDSVVSFTVGLKAPGDLEHDASDTLAVVFAEPVRTEAQARDLAEAVAADPDALDGAAAAGVPGVIDRRAVVAGKFPPDAGREARHG